MEGLHKGRGLVNVHTRGADFLGLCNIGEGGRRKVLDDNRADMSSPETTCASSFQEECGERAAAEEEEEEVLEETNDALCSSGLGIGPTKGMV